MFGFETGKLIPTQHQSFLDTPVFLGHTRDDEVTDIELGEQSRCILEKMGMKITWREHQEGGHLGLLDSAGLDDVAAYLGELTGSYSPWTKPLTSN